MRIIMIKLMLPAIMGAILIQPFIGVLFFMLIAFVRLEVLTWNMVDARFAFTTSILTLIGWLFHAVIRRDTRQHAVGIPVQYWLYLVVLVGLTITTLTAEASVDASWVALQKFFKYGVFLFLMVQMVNTEVRLRLVQEVFFWGISFLVVWGIDQYFRGNYRLENVGGGDFADSSGLASIFLIVWPCAVYRLYHPNRWVKFTGAVFAPLFLVALSFTESRSGFLGLVAAVVIMFLRERKKMRYVIAAIPILIVLIPVMPDSFWDRMQTITSGTKEGEKRERSADQRVKVWTVAVAVIKDHPFLGIGRGNFGLIHGRYAHPIWYGQIPDDLYEDLFMRYRVCHNLWLDLLVSNGLITFIPWLMLVGSIPLSFRRLRARLSESPMDVYWRYQTYGLEAGIVAYLVTGTFQDLAEVEAFYWVVMFAGITRVVIARRVDIREARDKKVQVIAAAPARELIRGAITPGRRETRVNPWFPAR